MTESCVSPSSAGWREGRLAGALWVLASAAGFGAMAIFAKLAYRDGLTLTTMLFLRFFLAGVALAAWGVWRGMHWPRGRDFWLLVGMGGIGYVGQAYCYFSSLHYASAGLVALLLYLYPALVTLLSALVLKRPVGRGRAWAVAIALLGSALTVSGELHSSMQGIALGAGAALIYSVYILVGDGVMQRVAPLAAATVVILSAALVYGGLAAYEGFAWPGSSTGWSAVVAIALFSTLLAILGFFQGLEKLGASDASTLSTAEPLITLILAALVLGETITGMQMAGGLLILATVIYLSRQSGAVHA